MGYDADAHAGLAALAATAGERSDVPQCHDDVTATIQLASRVTRRIVWWSKWHSTRRMLGLLWPLRHVTVVNVLGVPSVEHVRAVRALQRHYGCRVGFVGDLDPHDLTVFWYLRAGGYGGASSSEPDLDVEYLGVDARWIAACRAHRVDWRGVPGGGIEGEVTVALDDFETRSLAWLAARMDLRALLGEEALRMLEGGLKLEQEGATNPVAYAADLTGEILRNLFGEDA